MYILNRAVMCVTGGGGIFESLGVTLTLTRAQKMAALLPR